MQLLKIKKHSYYYNPNTDNEWAKDEIYENNEKSKITNDLQNNRLAVHNGCHATNLIQISRSNNNQKTFNILTDPVFHHLNPIIYRNKTKTIGEFDNINTWMKLV